MPLTRSTISSPRRKKREDDEEADFEKSSTKSHDPENHGSSAGMLFVLRDIVLCTS